MKVIHKYRLPKPNQNGISSVTLPRHAQILSAGVQVSDIVLWALVDAEAASETVFEIRIAATGEPLGTDPGLFIGTVQELPLGLNGPQLVWHLFQRNPT